MKNDLTICCFSWGGWCQAKGEMYVNRLYRGVQRFLKKPFRFVCFTDDENMRVEEEVELLPMDVPFWRWNLRKQLLYKPDNGLTGRVVCLDLDVVITGSLSELVMYDGPFITCEAAYHKDRVGGSMIGFEAGTLVEELWSPLISNPTMYERETNGMERRYLEMRFDSLGFKPDFWQHKYPGQVLSYKLDCQEGLPDNARVVRFHGIPRPHDVEKMIDTSQKDIWMKEFWK